MEDSLSKSDFQCQESCEFFWIKIYNLRAHFLLKIFSINIETLYILKAGSIFDELSFVVFNDFLGQKSCFKGSIIKEIPKPNWYKLCFGPPFLLTSFMDVPQQQTWTFYIPRENLMMATTMQHKRLRLKTDSLDHSMMFHIETKIVLKSHLNS